MDLIIEIILELIFEGTVEISSNKKVPKWIRYPLIAILTLLISTIIIGIFILGIHFYQENIIIALFLIIISIIFSVSGISKFKKLYLEKKEDNNDQPNNNNITSNIQKGESK